MVMRVFMGRDSHGLKAVVLSSSLRGFTLISGINAGVFSLGIKVDFDFIF